MLGRSYNTVVPFAQELAAQGLTIAASPSSVLSELCSLSAPVEFQQEKQIRESIPADSDINGYGMALDFHTQGDNGLDWGTSFDVTVERIANLLRTQIGYIRNTVVPMTVEFSKEASLFIQELGSTSPSNELEICRESIPDFALEPTFLTLLESFRFKKPIRPTSYSLSFNLASAPEDYLSIASTSNARIDAMIAAWAKGCDLPYLQMAWYTFFATGPVTSGYKGKYLNQDDLFSPSVYTRLNVGLAYFLIANYYSNHLPDMVTNEDVSVIKRRLYNHLSFAGSVVCEALKLIEQNNKSNIMVTYVDTFHKKIVVSAEVYDRWLAAGGNAEAVMGILVGTKRYYSVPEIDSHIKELHQAWHTYANVHIETIEFKKADTLRAFYLALLGKYSTSEYQDTIEKSYLQSNTQFTAGTLKKASTILNGLKKEALSNTSFVAKELIAGLKYQFTYAHKFINDMDQIGSHVEQAVPEEAALVATLNYVVDYLRGQIRVIKA